MNLLPAAQATLLLTSYFTKIGREDAKPLTNAEWGRFALWLKKQSATPADLLGAEAKSLLRHWSDAQISLERIVQLLNRGHSLAIAVEKWQRAGLWIVTRADLEYPNALKRRLKVDAPPVLFGCGNKNLLSVGGLAVVGSRNANDVDLSYAYQVGKKAALEGIGIISGGARGVDEAAMQGAMQLGGQVLGVIPDGLLKIATSAKWRSGLLGGNVALVSPFYPEAGFSAGNAMARNKYIYCLADSSLVVHSGKKGGTFNGAIENLKKGWVPLWVKRTEDRLAANADLVDLGGTWVNPELLNLKVSNLCTVHNTTVSAIVEKQSDLFFMPGQSELHKDQELKQGQEKYSANVLWNAQKINDTNLMQEVFSEEKACTSVNFYQIFIGELQRLALTPINLDSLIENTDLQKSQLNEWLKRAVEEGVVEKLNHPVRYQYKK